MSDAPKKSTEEVKVIKKAIAATRESLKGLAKQISDKMEEHKDGGEIKADAGKDGGFGSLRVKIKRDLKGHFSKVFGVQWSGDGSKLVSAAQDGFMIVWNPVSANKNITIPLKSTWIMMCAIEPTEGNITCTGGLDNTASLYSAKQPLVELHAHDGYLSSANFVSATTLLTASGDQTVKLWDLNGVIEGKQSKAVELQPLSSFEDHAADVGSIDSAIAMGQPDVFVSGSTDTTCRFWDMRQPNSTGCVRMSGGDDIIQVKFFPDAFGVGLAVGGTGVNKGDMVLADMRCLSKVKSFPGEDKAAGPESTALAFSSSGRLLFGGYEDNQLKVFDTLGSGASLTSQPAFDNARVADLAIAPGGEALAACSWDNSVRIFA